MTWVPMPVYDTYDTDHVRVHLEVGRIGIALQQNTAQPPANQGIAFRGLCNLREGLIYGVKKPLRG